MDSLTHSSTFHRRRHHSLSSSFVGCHSRIGGFKELEHLCVAQPAVCSNRLDFMSPADDRFHNSFVRKVKLGETLKYANNNCYFNYNNNDYQRLPV
jgi:hypothetical protein